MDNSDPRAPINYFKFANVMTVGLLAAQFIVIVLLGAYILFSLNYPHLFETTSPQTIKTPLVPLNGAVTVEATKCNVSGEDITVGIDTKWVREKPTYLEIPTTHLDVENGTVYPPGCSTRIFENNVPAGATPGVWHIQGVNVVQDRAGRRESVSWHTESFEIVAP